MLIEQTFEKLSGIGEELRPELVYKPRSLAGKKA